MIYVSADGHSGYALAAQAYMQGLLASGHELSWSPRVWKNCERSAQPSGIPVLDDCMHRPTASDRVLLHVVPEQLALLNNEFAAYQKFVYTVWETDRLPEHWVVLLNQARAVAVPCVWNQQVLQAAGVTSPVSVVPHVLSADVAAMSPAAPAEPFTFYSIGPWTRRKALDLLVEAFCRAFPHDEPVRLVLKTGRNDITRYSETWALRHVTNAWNSTARALQSIRRRHARPPRVETLLGDVPRSSILQLHASSHCYVSLTRSEGWGLGAFDAATLGNPVIMTGFGGQLDFLDPDLAYLVDYQMTACEVGPWESFYRGHQWAHPDVDHAAALMREVYSDYSSARLRALALRTRIRQRFSVQQVLPGLCEVLNR